METENGETEFFGTETMAELCARQGRLAEAIGIYQRLIQSRPTDDRSSLWQARQRSLQRAVGYVGTAATSTPTVVAKAPATETAPAPAAARATPPPPPQPRVRAAPTPSVSEQAAWEAMNQASQVHRLPLLVTQAVRSGQVVRAEKNDLIVLASVNSGAQLVADGNIHVYGVLRGQAIAGAMGCAQARIFCQRLEAELVAINGIYLIQEDIPPAYLGGPAQVYLQDDRCLIDRL